jgi:hypothetical protein
MKNKVNPYPLVGPQTKRETKKASKAAPKVPMTVSGTAAAKAAKKKKRIENIAVIGSTIAGTIGMIAADARLRRGGLRIQDRDKNLGGYNKLEPTRREKWDMGKNKKSTKK